MKMKRDLYWPLSSVIYFVYLRVPRTSEFSVTGCPDAPLQVVPQYGYKRQDLHLWYERLMKLLEDESLARQSRLVVNRSNDISPIYFPAASAYDHINNIFGR